MRRAIDERADRATDIESDSEAIDKRADREC